MERRRSAGASLPFIYRHYERLRALSANRETAGPCAMLEGSTGNGRRSGSWLFASWTQGDKAYASSGYAGGESAGGHWIADISHGYRDHSMRSAVRKGHSNHGPPRPRPLNGRAMAQVSLCAWKAPRKADLATARKKMILISAFPH